MELRTFSSQQAYTNAQVHTQRRRAGRSPHYWPGEMQRLATDLRGRLGGPPVRGICHGVMYGEETEELLEEFPGADIIGTDLMPRREGIVKWDFHKPNEQWTGKMDFVYSNSLDHSWRPEACLEVWFAQLAPAGRLYLEWSEGHTTVGGGDCFGAHLDEYMMLINAHNYLEDVLYLGGVTVLLVGRPAAARPPYTRPRHRRSRRAGVLVAGKEIGGASD